MIPSGILLYSQTDASFTCHQTGFTQQLMETEAEAHSQTVGTAWGILQKKGEGIAGVSGVKCTIRKPTEPTNLGSQQIKEI